MINFSKELGVVTTAIALTSATIGVLPAAAFQIIKHEFSGTLELLYSSITYEPIIDDYIFEDIISEPIIFEPIIDDPIWWSINFVPIDVPFIEFPRQTRDYEGFVEYTTEGELLSWFLDVEGSSQLGSDRLKLFRFEPLPFEPLPFEPYSPITVTTFEATPDNWTLDIDFRKLFYTDFQRLTWNRESGIRFTRDFALLLPTIYVDPNPNFSETITEDPSKPDATSVPEPASGLALLGLTALGAGSLLRKKDK